jgi:hypothetical protein
MHFEFPRWQTQGSGDQRRKNLRHLRHLRILIPVACFATQGNKKESTDLKDYADEIRIF